MLEFPPHEDGWYRAICLDGPLRGTPMASRTRDFVAPSPAINVTISFIAGIGQVDAVQHQMAEFRYEWSDHWVYSHVELENGNIMLTQIREPVWRCGEL